MFLGNTNYFSMTTNSNFARETWIKEEKNTILLDGTQELEQKV